MLVRILLGAGRERMRSGKLSKRSSAREAQQEKLSRRDMHRRGAGSKTRAVGDEAGRRAANVLRVAGECCGEGSRGRNTCLHEDSGRKKSRPDGRLFLTASQELLGFRSRGFRSGSFRSRSSGGSVSSRGSRSSFRSRSRSFNSRSFSSRSSGFFFLTASGQGNSGEQRGDQERFFHFLDPLRINV